MRKSIGIILAVVMTVCSVQFVFVNAADDTELYFENMVESKITSSGTVFAIEKDTEFDVAVKTSAAAAVIYSYELYINLENKEQFEIVGIKPASEDYISGLKSVDKEKGEARLAAAMKKDKKGQATLAYVTLKSKVNNTAIDVTQTVLKINKGATKLSKLYENEDLAITFSVQDFKLARPEMPVIESLSNPYTYGQSTTVGINCATKAARIYYTVNVNDIQILSKNLYSLTNKPVISVGSNIVRANALYQGMWSGVVEKTLRLNQFSDNSSSQGSWNPGTTTGSIYMPADPEPDSEKYTDIQGHWAYNQIIALINKGVINGYDDGTVRPDGTVTRAEAAKIIVSAGGGTASTSITLTFDDTWEIADWARGWVQEAVNRGIINGYDDNTFKAANGLSRKEMAALAMRAFNFGENFDIELGFADAESIPQWARGYIGKAVELGIIAGYDDNTFQPDKLVTRAESCKIISLCLDKAGI